MNAFTSHPILQRRDFLGLSVAAASAALLAACSPQERSGGQRIFADDAAARAAEDARPSSGKTVKAVLTAGPVLADLGAVLGGRTLSTWGYGGALNGPLLRGSVGDRLEVSLRNGLPEPTSVHWHGLALANSQDGVEKLTQEATAAGAAFDYGFRLSHPGTYWYHSHMELQRERALYGALIVDDPDEAKAYDHEWIILLDDWLDGVTGTPEEVLAELNQGMGSMMRGGHMAMGSASPFLGGDAGDVQYPLHLFNGRVAADPDTLAAKPGDRVRLRIINAAGDTAYRVGAPGIRMTVTHTDGFPVEPREADAVVLGMGERIDALLTVTAGWTPLMALPEGKPGLALGRIRAGSGREPVPAALPSRISGEVFDGGRLTSAASVRLPRKPVTVRHAVRLTGSMMGYNWGINGRRFAMESPYDGALAVRQGDRVQLDFINAGMMWHPMHLHGHTFQIGESGARKDTVIVRPGTTVSVLFDAGNPGQWLYHCHNAYHAASGMMGVLSYVR